MSIPDPNAQEPVAELDANLYQQYKVAAGNAEAWANIAGRLKEQLQAQIGAAHAGTVDGNKVLTYRPSRKYAEAALQKQYPDMTQHFLRLQTREVFDMEAFAIRHPDIAEQFRVRSLREVAGGE